MSQIIEASSQRYVPEANEPYMSEAQIAYFKTRLMEGKTKLKGKITRSIGKIKTLEGVQADILDRSNAYIDLEQEVRNYERYASMLDQIEKALARIDDGSFGYCELTGSEIGLRRLEAIPFATMSIKALESFEAEQNGPARRRFS